MPTKPAAALVSTLARFVQGDIKGGEHAHAYRTEVIRTAIEQMFKGNYSPITEAAALTEGKAKKARAYHAGFATFGVIGTDIKKVDYVGRFDAPENKLARDQVASLTEHHTCEFFRAFDVVMAEKAAPKAKAVPAAPAAAPAATPEAETTSEEQTADEIRHLLAVEQDEAICKVVALLNVGMLTSDQLALLTEAVTAAAKRTESAPAAETV